MALSTQSFSTMQQNAVAAMQGAASALVDLTVGSILRAFVDTYCGLAMWLQGLALQVVSLTRFATSNGPDADTWGADFNFDRLPAVASTGSVTLGRYTPTNIATIQAGTLVANTDPPEYSGGEIVQSQDGTSQFQVIPDTNQSAYSAATNLYTIPAGDSTITATVQCTVAGSAGNVTAGLITVLGSSIPGVDYVNNPSAFDNGEDAELDPAYKARFPEYIASLEEGTPTAVENAVTSLQEGASCVLVENYNYSGVYQAGYFYCVCDDGSGSPSGTFLSNCYAAIDAVRAEGTTFGVIGPTIVPANIAMVITAAPGYVLGTLETAVIAAETAFINALAGGVELPYTRVAAIAYSVLGVSNVTNVTLNGGTADLAITEQQRIKIGSCAVT